MLRKWYERNGAVHTGTEKFDFFPFTCGYLTIDLREEPLTAGERTDPRTVHKGGCVLW